MKKIFCSVLLSTLISFIWADVCISIQFTGQSLNDYINQEVTFSQTLYVCGRYKDIYDNNYLYLSYKRLQLPSEIALEGTAEYNTASQECEDGILRAYFSRVDVDTVRLGATITNLSAKVIDDRYVTVLQNVLFDNNTRPTTCPSVGNARLRICSINLEYYCPEWEGTFSAATSDEDYERQHLKIMKAFNTIHADIYAVAEIQQGTTALRNIANGLNALTAPGRYWYVNDRDDITSTFTKVGYIYRTDRVRPILDLGHPFTKTQNFSAYYREYVQCFEELSTNERFVLCMNHLTSKISDNEINTDSIRVVEISQLNHFIEEKLSENYYQDSDILIVGDLNCATKENPIIYMENNNYQNMLAAFATDDYSYSYRSLTQYLDHVLASPSMSTQITGAVPYHLNADESSNYYYSYGDTTMYRFSDHDPIIIGLTLGNHSDAISEKTIDPTAKVYVSNGCIIIENSKVEPVTIYDILGKEIQHYSKIQNCQIAISQTGVYIVKIGATTQKIVVQH